MLTQNDAQAHAEKVAKKFEEMNYRDLLRLAQEQADNHEALCGFQKLENGEPYVDISVAPCGRLRKRMSVEVVVTDEGWEQWKQPGCVYFERFASGKLDRASAYEWQRYLFYLLVIIGGVGVIMSIITAIL